MALQEQTAAAAERTTCSAGVLIAAEYFTTYRTMKKGKDGPCTGGLKEQPGEVGRWGGRPAVQGKELEGEDKISTSMTSLDFDCIVIGAGIQGSFTAYHLAKNKKKTLLLEQFLLPHSRGSSHGQTRIIRKAYEQDFYVHMMEECLQLWTLLEAETNTKLYRRTGLLVMGPERGQSFELFKDTLKRNNVPTVSLERGEEFSRHIPHVTLRNGEGAIVDTTAGVLYADRALRAHAEAWSTIWQPLSQQRHHMASHCVH
ncbi:hypothetical protein JZ751_010781 [Albula glossodonta]|uniref:FAD dependent oxidoreductase domain-containing protein n=1 Tax=Albula glossodonta TaxID=121402 RepID=A0A8T2N2G3_9TELE|nr:hypothetical protein JZ751_010781 [Albula glossodonta]